ncbi:hypothetical protein RRC236 [Methanocella arvoryzae MRE50]|uniref:UPF0305 protein RRC236 n=2 Tax=Methanocella TaxID=570266 RepID=Q0W0W4_METAR|nr:hypothetical protein RRC236 [Methanocella arvoryzae MRE50]
MSGKNFQIFSLVARITLKRELAQELADEINRFSVYDLQYVSARLEKDISDLPSPYREKIRPYFMEQYFGRYNRIMTMRGSGELEKIEGEIKDPELFRDFCRMITARYPDRELQDEPEEYTQGSPFNSLFYYLISIFYMFVLDEPGHPAGMPFPGGFTVREHDGVVYCPIRDKEKDVEYSICNFCPAKQDDEF